MQAEGGGAGLELPSDIAAAWDTHQLDAVADWLLTRPVDERWTGEESERALVLVEVFLPIDPTLSLRLADRLLIEGHGDLHLLQLAVDAQARTGDPADLEHRVEQVREALTGADASDRAAVLNNVGTFLKNARLFDLAERILREAHLDARSVDPATRATVLVNLATVIADRSRAVGTDTARGSTEALEVLEEAERAVNGAGQPRIEGSIWFNRGHILAVNGSSAQAAHAYQVAEEQFTHAGGDPVDLAYVYRARAADAGRNGRLSDALGDYARARDLFADAGQLDEAATAAVGLVMAMQLSGDAPTPGQLEDVLDALRRSRPDRVPELLVNLGNIAAEQALDLADRYFSDAETAFQEQQRVLDVERARHARAVIRRRAGDPAGAVPLLRGVHENYSRWGLDVKAAEAEFNLAVALRDLRDPQARDHALHAFEVLDRHRHELGTASDRSGLTRVTYRHLLNLALDTAGDADTIAALAERARTQTAADTARAPGSDQLAAPAPVRARPGGRVIGGAGEIRTLSALAADLGGPDAVWLTWVRHRGMLLRIVVGPEATTVSGVPFPAGLLRALHTATALDPSDEAAESDAGDERAALYRIATGPLLADTDLAGRLRHSMRPGTAVAWTPGPNGEGQTMLNELADALILDEVRDAAAVVIGPPTFLGAVPWAALERDQVHWIERSALVLAPPVSTIRPAPAARSGSGRTWIADATGDLRYCRRTLPGQHVLAGVDATVAAVTGALRGTSRVVLRTHVRPGSPARPREAALLLADGPLTAHALHDALGHGPPEWVILGCDAAGAGVGDEWAGLPVGLGTTGAERLVVTLWPIVDAPEQESLDLALTASIEQRGIREGLRVWQADCARRWRDTRDRTVSPHRWAGHALVVTVTGSDRSSSTP